MLIFTTLKTCHFGLSIIGIISKSTTYTTIEALDIQKFAGNTAKNGWPEKMNDLRISILKDTL